MKLPMITRDEASEREGQGPGTEVQELEVRLSQNGHGNLIVLNVFMAVSDSVLFSGFSGF